MLTVNRPNAYILLSTNHGTMIVNRNDYNGSPQQGYYGVGYQLMTTGSFDYNEVKLACLLIEKRRAHYGDGVVALDCGANIGVHTIEWARLMYGWGVVHAFEAQEKVFYALAGNVAINNCFNVRARHCAVGASAGFIDIPEPNYDLPSSFGSFEIRQKANSEFIGQAIDHSRAIRVPIVPIDELDLPRLDFLKIDVEGMEMEVFRGAEQSIARHKPVMLVEYIKSDLSELEHFLGEQGYRFFKWGINLVAMHQDDPVSADVDHDEGRIHIR